MSTCAPRSREDLLEMAKAIVDLDRVQAAKVLSDARNKQPGPIYWTWVNGLISGIITHTKYIGANALYSTTERGVVTPIAAIIGKAKELAGVGSDLDRVFFGETAAGMWGMVSAVPSSFMTAARSVKAGMKIPLDSEVELRAAAQARGEKVPASMERSVNPISGLERPLPGVWGRIIGFPGDAATGIHTFFKILGEQASLEAQAYRGAAKEGLSPTDRAFWDRKSDLSANPTEAMRKTAVEEAYKDTFMAELGPRGQQWSRFSKSNPVLKWIFPFAHIPINLMKATYEATPFAFADSAMRENLLGRNGGVAQDKAIARMVVGSSIMGYFVMKAMNGQATGDYPDDPKERDQWKLAGKEPNSILLGDYWISYNKFGPAGDLANIGSNIAAVVARAGKMDDEAMTGATWKAAEAAGRLVADEVGFNSLQNLFEAMHDEKKGVAWAASTASSFLPFSSLVSQTASLRDPYMREAKTFTDGLKYRIPGERETLLPKRDWSGQPIANPGYGGGPAMGIVRARAVNTDPVDLEMATLGIHPAPPQDRIAGVKLPAELYDKYQTTAGAFTRTALENMVRQPGWYNLAPFVRDEVFRKTISATRQAAAAAMQARYPQIIQTAVQNKVNKITGAPQATMTGP